MYGSAINVDGYQFYLFPKTENLAEARIEDLLKAKIGFRAKYIKTAAQRLLSTRLKGETGNLSKDEIRDKLLEFYGVGEKIADCVLCYSLGCDNVTPIDVWGKRIATELYGLDVKKRYKDYRDWFSNYFNGYAAWAGQFLFEYIRNHKNR
jgi:N-glycosylase/DNA lyase